MVPSLIARVDGVDGLPQLVAPERVWPDPTCPPVKKRGVGHGRREVDARQTGVVMQARLPRWARHLLAVPDFEETEIQMDLARAGLL